MINVNVLLSFKNNFWLFWCSSQIFKNRQSRWGTFTDRRWCVWLKERLRWRVKNTCTFCSKTQNLLKFLFIKNLRITQRRRSNITTRTSSIQPWDSSFMIGTTINANSSQWNGHNKKQRCNANVNNVFQTQRCTWCIHRVVLVLQIACQRSSSILWGTYFLLFQRELSGVWLGRIGNVEMERHNELTRSGTRTSIFNRKC